MGINRKAVDFVRGLKSIEAKAIIEEIDSLRKKTDEYTVIMLSETDETKYAELENERQNMITHYVALIMLCNDIFKRYNEESQKK